MKKLGDSITMNSKKSRLAKDAKKKYDKSKIRDLHSDYNGEVNEPTKQLTVLKANNCNEKVMRILRNLVQIRKPFAKFPSTKKNSSLIDINNNIDKLDFFSSKYDSPLMIIGSSTKKHANRLFFYRSFNKTLYDLHEFDVIDFNELDSHNKYVPIVGSKPIVLFLGAFWEASNEYLSIQNSFCDIFGGIKAESILLNNIDSAIVCTAADIDGSPCFDVRHFYIIKLKGQGSEKINSKLVKTGFSLKLKHISSRLPTKETIKIATRLPDEHFLKKKKAVTVDDMQQTKHKVIVQQEDMGKLYLKHGKN